MAGKDEAQLASLDVVGGRRVARALGGILLSLGLALALALLLVTTGTATRGTVAAVSSLLVAVALLYLLYRTGRVAATIYGLVAVLILAGMATSAAYGSVRSAGFVLFVAAIIVGGIFLGRAALLSAVAASAVALALVVHAQRAGWLPVPDLAASWIVWAIYVVALSVIALNIHFARGLAIDAAQRAREGEARFRALFEWSTAATSLFTFDEGRILDCNDAYVRLVARPREAIVGRTGREIGFWRDLSQRERAREALQRGEPVSDFPVDVVTGTGEVLHCIFSWNLIEVDGRKLVLSHITDITARQRAEAKLRASEERFHRAFRSSPIGMTITRLSDGRFLEANDADRHTLGYTREELLQLDSLRSGTWASPADRERFVAELKAKGRVLGLETRMRNRWGEPIDARVCAELVELEGEPCVLASVINVTGQKRQEALVLEIARGVASETGEEFFRSLVRHLARTTGAHRVMVAELTDDGRRMRSLARYADGEDAPLHEYRLAGTPGELVLRRADVVVIGDGVATRFPEADHLTGAQARGYIGAPLLGPDGRPQGVISALTREPMDRSEMLEAVFRIFAARAQAELERLQRDREIRRLNEELEQRVRERTVQLESANRELETFSYSVSHDLRAPLRAIDGFTRILGEELAGKLDERQQRLFSRVVANTERMGRLIADLLALSRVSGQPLQPQPVDLSALADEVVQELREREPGRIVHAVIEPGAGAACDRELLRIVLENLLGNAWKFTSRLEEAHVAFGCEPAPGGECVFYVRDDGAGFDPAYSDKLFAPFQRLHGPGEFEGTGIGLATVQRIVARHGGRVWAESSPGKGATFRFTLPYIV